MKSQYSIFYTAIIVTNCFLFCSKVMADYPVAIIKNNSEYVMSGMVQYASAFCKNDYYTVGPNSAWRAPKPRGICLITGISGAASETSKGGESTRVSPYSSTGTSYSQFQISAFGGQYRIFSKQEYAKVSNVKQGYSPGFYLVNRTEWPVAYSLEQVGCLYHGIVPRNWNGRDGVIQVDTGAVWFTLRARIQPDGINPQSDWDCVEPVAEIVGDALFAAMSGGSSLALVGPKYVVKVAAKQAIKRAIKASAKSIRNSMISKVGEYLLDAGSVTMAGQYAGYEWPFRCEKPTYVITGGPRITKDEYGEVYVIPGDLFSVVKVNNCGNDMMRASPTSISATASLPFPTFQSSPNSNQYDHTPNSLDARTNPRALSSKTFNYEQLSKTDLSRIYLYTDTKMKLAKGTQLKINEFPQIVWVIEDVDSLGVLRLSTSNGKPHHLPFEKSLIIFSSGTAEILN